MSDALPALARGLINSVIPPFGNPPPITWSRKGKPVIKHVVATAGTCGKRSANSFRRSIILPFGAIQEQDGTCRLYVQTNSDFAPGHDSARALQVTVFSAVLVCAPARPSRLGFSARVLELGSDNAGFPP